MPKAESALRIPETDTHKHGGYTNEEMEGKLAQAKTQSETARLWRELGRMRRERPQIAEIIRKLYKGEAEEKIVERIAAAEKSLDKRIATKEDELKKLAGKGVPFVEDNDIIGREEKSVEPITLEIVPPPLSEDALPKKQAEEKKDDAAGTTRPRSRILDTYGAKEYPTVAGGGGIGVGTVASAMDRGSGVLRHYTGRKGAETETIPEMTDEEAIYAYLDRDLAKKETSIEKQLKKLFTAEPKIYLENEEDPATITADKTFLQALEIDEWKGDLQTLAKIAAEISVEKSDELVALKHQKGFFKRLFKSASPEEKELAKQMHALDDLLNALAEHKVKPGQILKTMSQRRPGSPPFTIGTRF